MSSDSSASDLQSIEHALRSHKQVQRNMSSLAAFVKSFMQLSIAVHAKTKSDDVAVMKATVEALFKQLEDAVQHRCAILVSL